MSFNIAKRAIDFYLERSKKANELCLSFYGGEPLLAFELIKKCVRYIMDKKGNHPYYGCLPKIYGVQMQVRLFIA